MYMPMAVVGDNLSSWLHLDPWGSDSLEGEGAARGAFRSRSLGVVLFSLATPRYRPEVT